MTQTDDSPTQPPKPTTAQRGPIPVPNTAGISQQNPSLSQRVVDVLRGHPGAGIVLFDERDEDGNMTMNVYAASEKAIDEIVQGLSKA